MTTIRELLDAADKWSIDAAVAVHELNTRRAAILKDAKRLKVAGVVKGQLVYPKLGGEPVAPEPPGPFPSNPASTALNSPREREETLRDMAADEADLAIPPALKRTS